MSPDLRVLKPGGRISLTDVIAEDELSAVDRAERGLDRLHRRRPVQDEYEPG